MAALEAALLHLAPSVDLQLSNGGRYPGVYRLLSHENSQIRSLVSSLFPCILEQEPCKHLTAFVV